MVNYTFIYSIINWLLRDIERIKILIILLIQINKV